MPQGAPAEREPIVRRVGEIATGTLLERGRALCAVGAVISVRVDGGNVSARVMDGVHLYRTSVAVRPGGDLSCTCSTWPRKTCAHSVAALLHVSGRTVGMPAAGEVDERALLRSVPREELEKFLWSEMRKNAEVRTRFLVSFGGSDGVPRIDYRKEVDAMFDDVEVGSAWKKISFATFFRAARARERDGHVAEAIRIYREVSEAVRRNYHVVDDSGGHYSETIYKAVLGMVACICRQKMGGEEKRQHIAYLYGRFLAEDPDVCDDAYYAALSDVCTTKADLEYLRRLNGQSLSGNVGGNGRGPDGMADRILLQTEVLEKMGETDAADGLFREHYMENAGFCGAYVEFLAKRDPAKVPGVLEEARAAFSGYDFEYVRRMATGGK